MSCSTALRYCQKSIVNKTGSIYDNRKYACVERVIGWLSK